MHLNPLLSAHAWPKHVHQHPSPDITPHARCMQTNSPFTHSDQHRYECARLQQTWQVGDERIKIFGICQELLDLRKQQQQQQQQDGVFIPGLQQDRQVQSQDELYFRCFHRQLLRIATTIVG